VSKSAKVVLGSLLFLDKIRLGCPPAAEPGVKLCTMKIGNERPIAERPPSAGVEDLVIVPLVVIVLVISKLLKAVLSILIYVLDYAFPILLQLMRSAVRATESLFAKTINRGAYEKRVAA